MNIDEAKALGQRAQDHDLLPHGTLNALPVFPAYHEPEAKIDLKFRHRFLLSIRNILAKKNKHLRTSIIPETINMGGHGMVNMIVEPFSEDEANKGIAPLFIRHGKFMRIAARVDDMGRLYNFKIAIKCLSSSVVHQNGLPFRQEFEPALPKSMSLSQSLDWFLKEYEKTYKDNSFSHITLDDLRPTSGYFSARTGFYFLKNMPAMQTALLSEACEDLFLPVGPDLATAFTGTEAQFEWETVSALTTVPRVKMLDLEQSRINLGLQSMQHTLKYLTQNLHPNKPWENFTVADSKAEISRERTLDHPNFRSAEIDLKTGATMSFRRARISKNTAYINNYLYVLQNSRPVSDLINDPKVQDHLCWHARVLERQRLSYNQNAAPALAHNPKQQLTH